MSVQEVIFHPAKNIPLLINDLEKNDEASQALLREVVASKEKILSIPIEYWEQLYRLAFALLNKGNCYAQYKIKKASDERVQLSLDLLEKLRAIDNYQHVFQKILDLLKVFLQPECQFVILEELTSLALKAHGIDYSSFLPKILRTIAVILHQYINIKKSKASSDKDKLELQIILEQNCEDWTRDFLVSVIHRVGDQIALQASARRYFLNFCGDAVEALLQNQLEGTFKAEVLQVILKAIVYQVLKHYSPLEITEIQGALLKKHRYHHEKQNLEVPEKYEPYMLLNISGQSYLINKYVDQPSFLWFFSDESILKTLIPAVSESFQKTFPHRFRLLDKLVEYLGMPGKTSIRYDSINQYGYPLSNLLDSLLSYDDAVDIEKVNTVIRAVKPSVGLFQRMLEFSQSQKVLTYIVSELLKVQDYPKWKKVLFRLQIKASGTENQAVQQLFERVRANVKEDWAAQLISHSK